MKLSFLTTIYILLLSAFTYASEVVSPSCLKKGEDGKYYYDTVLNVGTISKQALYKKMKDWTMTNIKTIDNNISFDDNTFETIITTPTINMENLPHNWRVSQSINFKLKISFKENRMRIQANSFSYFGKAPNDTGLRGGAIETTEYNKAFIKSINEKFDSTFLMFISQLSKVAQTNEKEW